MNTVRQDPDEAARAEILVRLAASREELRRILDPPPPEPGASVAGAFPDGFPRSRTMQMLLSARGLGTLGAVTAGILVARPMLVLRLLRLLPAGPFAKVLAIRILGALRDKQQPSKPGTSSSRQP